MDEIKVLIADDHPVVRRGLRQVVESDPKLKVIAEAGDGEEALRVIEELKPDVAVLDLDMPEKNGFDVVREGDRRGLQTQIIILTMHGEEDLFNEALDLGVKGYIIKDSAITDIVSGIRAAARGSHFISPQLSSYLINRNRRDADFTARTPGLGELTPTERKILRLVADGKSSKEIADQLFISHRTVENHRTNICSKLDLHGSHALLKFALQNKSEL